MFAPKFSLAIVFFAVGSLCLKLEASSRQYYQEPAWQPRAHPTLEDVLGDDFHPPPPALPKPISYDTPGFAADRLHLPPPPGVHPRVLVTPEDIAAIRARVAQGELAPLEFRTLWTRVRDSRSAFSALIAEDNALGRNLAADLVERLRQLEPKIDRMDTFPDAHHIWSVERSMVASGDPEPPHEIWSLLDYDYLHGWMTPEERALAERVITRLVKDRMSNYLAEPDHFMINNHKGFGMEFIRLMLLVEGTAGFPEATFQKSVQKCRATLDWFLSSDGMCYESIKGWLNTSVFVAVGRRDRDFLRHDHLVSKLRFFQAALRFENGTWKIRDEMRASAFHVIWLMRFLYPENPSYDLLYNATLTSHDFLTNTQARWPDPVGIAAELLLLFAGGGPGDDQAGKLTDWKSQAAIDQLNLPLTWKDDYRGYIEARNSWRIGDLHLGFVNKQDFYYGGHEGSEANRITLWKDGVNWIKDEDLLAVKATGLQNMLTINGRGLAWPPAPGVWLGVNEGPHGLSAAGDARIAYSYSKVMQVHPLSFPSGKLPYYKPFTESNFYLRREHQIAFHPGTVAFYDGYGHTDYGPWSGETRLVEGYRLNNPMAQADRTVHLARGKHPYVLLFDDARKADDETHLFEASFNLPDDVVVVDAKTSEIQFQNVEPSERRESEFLLAPSSVTRDPKTGRPAPKKGEPLMLVRILYRNSEYGYPVPRVQILPGRPERPFVGFSQLVVPALSVSPEFRLLFYPHRKGDPLPITSWNDDRSRLTIKLGDVTDTYDLEKTEGGRTVFEFRRDGEIGLANPASPARPILIVEGDRFDAHALRTTRRDGEEPQYVFGEKITVSFERVRASSTIRYTLDGSEPTASSPRFAAPFHIEQTATLKARVFDSAWKGSSKVSDLLTAHFEQIKVPVGVSKPNGATSGLLSRIYEINTKLWDDRGFFRAEKIMLPDLDQYKPLVTAQSSEGFVLPHGVPAAPLAEQTKGFYRFTGWFKAEKSGNHRFRVHSCGPVLLTVAGQDAIAETGVYHQDLRNREGTIVLGAGWHPIELIVTDPLFWNITTAESMPFSVELRDPNTASFALISSDRLLAVFPQDAAVAHPIPLWKNPATPSTLLEPGAIRSTYERDGLTREPNYLDIEGLTPRTRSWADVLEGNQNPAQAVVYDAWFEAPMDGLYSFSMPARKNQEKHLGAFRSAYQSQLRVGNEIVVQRGIAGRVPIGVIGLKAGMHPFSLRLGSSPAEVTVTYPDGQRLMLEATQLKRSSQVSIRPEGVTYDQFEWEIFDKTRFVYSLSASLRDELRYRYSSSIVMSPISALPSIIDNEVRYTLDGSEPNNQSPLMGNGVELSESATLRASLFLNGKQLTEPVTYSINKVTRPELGTVARIDFSKWNGKTGFVNFDERCIAWIAGIATPGSLNGQTVLLTTPVVRKEGPGGVDINMTRRAGSIPLKLSGLHLRDPDFTVGLWFRTDTGDGQLFGKHGLTAFGKSYRTVSCSVKNGQIIAGPARIRGGKITPGKWHHAALTITPTESTLYLDGKPIGSAYHNAEYMTDALDFFTNHAGAIGSVNIFNRNLEANSILQWYESEKSSYQD